MTVRDKDNKDENIKWTQYIAKTGICQIDTEAKAKKIDYDGYVIP